MDNVTRFDMTVKAINSYLEREGDCFIPYTHVECVDGSNYPLGAWTGYVRQRRRRGQLAPSKIEKLESIPGWQWGPLRPGPATNANRNNEIMALHAAGKSLSYIADEFQLSRQRVHQIVRKTKKVNA
jgi:hypothetical protein